VPFFFIPSTIGNTFHPSCPRFSPVLIAEVAFIQFSKENRGFRMDDSDKAEQGGEHGSDWHPADIQAALKKRGLSLAGLSGTHGYHATAAGKALRHPWPALEMIIAQAIGLEPKQIWPSRYRSNGTIAISKNLVIKND
jgi:Ner family transcriptional regulator